MGIPDSFLLDEVRCGFLVPAAVKQAWAAELEVLMEIDRVCRKHNIQYYADWGTLLGTVRHGGFIPWDDDLDIVMKRADYEKFMTVARYDLEEGFDVQTFRNQKDFWLFMGKVVGKNRFCFEKDHLRRFHNFPYIACVDIFVLDYVYADEEKEEQRRILCKYMLGVADAIVEGTLPREEWNRCFEIIEEMGGGTIRPISDPIEMGRYLYGEVEKIFAWVPEEEAKELTQLFPWGLKGNGLHIPKDVYSEPVYLPFECTKMPVPRLYDKMLRMRYGDYMKLVKSGGGHNYPFFEGQKKNLQKVLDFELPEFKFDINKLERSDEEKSYRSLSYKVMAKECTDELDRMKNALISDIEDGIMDNIISLIQSSQQLAIDMGIMIEQIKGEGCAVVKCLEKYCEALYGLYECLVGMYESEDALCGGEHITVDECVEKLNAALEQFNSVLSAEVLNRKTVLFMPVLSKDWKGLQEVWKTVKNNSDYDVQVVALPYFYKDYDGSPKGILGDDGQLIKGYNCDLTQFPEEINARDYKCITEEYLEMLHPEIIVIQNPYDSWNTAVSIPRLFYSENIRKYTDKLVYISPFAADDFFRDNERAYTNMKYYVTMPGVVYADEIYVSSEVMKQIYVTKLTEFAGEDTKAVWEERVRMFSNATDNHSKNVGFERKKKIIYGISLGTCLEDETKAKAKIEGCMDIFEKYRDSIEVIVLLFPQEELSDISEYDAYYGDPTPIATAFMEAGKLVMIQNVDDDKII